MTPPRSVETDKTTSSRSWGGGVDSTRRNFFVFYFMGYGDFGGFMHVVIFFYFFFCGFGYI
jgi:hypothetical protein